jgi:hypothetical protein
VEACDGTRAGHGARKVKHCEHKRPVSAVPQGTDNQDSGKRQQGQQNRDWKETFGLDRAASSPEGTKIEVPLDIVMSLLRPDELEKLKNYITSYLTKRDGSEVK